MAERYTRRRIGDRRDGRKLHNVSSSLRISPFFQRSRGDATGVFSDFVEVSGADEWLRARIAEGSAGFSMAHIVIAAYVRTVALCPGVNRFVAGHQLFARNGIEVILAGGRSGGGDGASSTIKVSLDPTDTVFDVYRKINDRIDRIKADYGAGDLERISDFALRLPRFLLRFLTGGMRVLDYFGWLGQNALDMSPYHGSLVLTDNGLQGLPPFTRPLHNFGSVPLSVCLGRKRQGVEADKSGRLLNRRYIDYSVSLDERIADTAYWATALKYLKYFIANPSELEKRPERVLDDEM